MKNTALFASTFAVLTWVPPAYAQAPEEPNHLRTSTLTVSGQTTDYARAIGLLVFTTPFNTLDGLGDGPSDGSAPDPTAFGERPTLQGNGTFLRVNGLDAQSCNECHVFVSQDTRPPTLGIGGVGGVTANAIIAPTLVDVADSADKRVRKGGPNKDMPLKPDGVADYNGRFSNAPFLFGGGGVEALAKEMTVELQAALSDCVLFPDTPVDLVTTAGTDFGVIVCDNAGDVNVSGTEGIVPREDVSDLTDVSFEEASEMLVVRPFGRKGENFSMRDFDRGAMQFHFGIQPEEVVGEADADGDGVPLEVTVDEMSALHVFDVTNPPPRIDGLSSIEPLTFEASAQDGFDTFVEIGCADCHVPVMKTASPSLSLAHPEVATDPAAEVLRSIDLVFEVGFEPVPDDPSTPEVEQGVYVPLFADLKRHKMGPRLAEGFARGEIANDEFTTARLWGIADTAPYLHDGRASTLYQAIEFHGGEAQQARDDFVALSDSEQSELVGFLKRLRTPVAPNTDIDLAVWVWFPEL